MKDKIKNIPIDKIKGGEFTKDTEPRDDYLIELINQSVNGEIESEVAVLDMDDILPFSDYKPKISPQFHNYFIDRLEAKDQPALQVYYKNGKFIMSDDYNTYYMYKECGFSKALCYVYGKVPSEYRSKADRI